MQFNTKYKKIMEAFKLPGSTEHRKIALYIKSNSRPATSSETLQMLAEVAADGYLLDGEKVEAICSISDKVGIIAIQGYESDADIYVFLIDLNVHGRTIYKYFAETDNLENISGELLKYVKSLRPNVTSIEFGKSLYQKITPMLSIAAEITTKSVKLKSYIIDHIKDDLERSKDYEIITYFSASAFGNSKFPDWPVTLVAIKQEFKDTEADTELETIYRLARYTDYIYPISDKDYASIEDLENEINNQLRNYIPNFPGFKFTEWIPVGYVDSAFISVNRDDKPNYAILNN